VNERIGTRVKDERGASLMLVIAFMVLAGTVAAAVISTSTSGIQQRVVLDQARDRQYAADAAIETTVAAARGLSGTCPPPPPTSFPLNHLNVHVDCRSNPAVIVGHGIPKLQKNLIFVACLTPGTAYGPSCTSTNVVINAQVNFQGTAPGPVTTYVQAWSVNG
jgi:hypothetical protein